MTSLEIYLIGVLCGLVMGMPWFIMLGEYLESRTWEEAKEEPK